MVSFRQYIEMYRCLGPILVAESESLEDTWMVIFFFSLFLDAMLDSVLKKIVGASFGG